MNTNNAWINMCLDILNDGADVTCRGYNIKEILGYRASIPMSKPIVNLTQRKIGYRFMLAEAAWVLSGDNRVLTLKPYSKMVEKFSDDGLSFFGAYGPPVRDQIEYICRAMKKDLYTRQAVISIWRPKPPESKDIPCTLSLQFMVRDYDGLNILHCFANLRSSDAWLGVPYDWFTFSMISAYIAIYLKNVLEENIFLGNLFFYAASEHLYKDAFGYNIKKVSDMLTENNDIDFNYKEIGLYKFDKPDELMWHLKSMAENTIGLGYDWLTELETYLRSKNG